MELQAHSYDREGAVAAMTGVLAITASIAAVAAKQANERENANLHAELLKVEKMGDIVVNKGDYDSGLLAYDQDLATAQQLAQNQPKPAYLLDVGLTHARIAYAFLSRCASGESGGGYCRRRGGGRHSEVDGGGWRS